VWSAVTIGVGPGGTLPQFGGALLRAVCKVPLGRKAALCCAESIALFDSRPFRWPHLAALCWSGLAPASRDIKQWRWGQGPFETGPQGADAPKLRYQTPKSAPRMPRIAAHFDGLLRTSSASLSEGKRKKPEEYGLFRLHSWCPGPESNRHALRRGILSPLRLPISPPGQKNVRAKLWHSVGHELPNH
jgi:hypothetical protein